MHLQSLLFLTLVGLTSAASNNTWWYNDIYAEIIDFGSKVKDSQVDRLLDTLFEVYPQERDTYNPEAPDYVKLVFDPKYTKIAKTWGDTITINPKFVIDNPEDLDFMTHELMHVTQFSK
jgi:hypothetical protein